MWLHLGAARHQSSQEGRAYQCAGPEQLQSDTEEEGDLQATILHQIGIDPHRFSFAYEGLNQRLIGPTEEGRVIKEIIS